MLRMETETGWWLHHPSRPRAPGRRLRRRLGQRWLSQARAARDRVLKGIAQHDDGWAARDAHPAITREGKPSAFSIELVGKYSAFEEIDLEEYLAVRERAVRIIGSGRSICGAAYLHAHLQSAHGACRPLHDRTRKPASSRPIS